MTKKKATTYRLSPETLQQLDQIYNSGHVYGTMTQVVEEAISRLWDYHFGMARYDSQEALDLL